MRIMKAKVENDVDFEGLKYFDSVSQENADVNYTFKNCKLNRNVDQTNFIT